MSSDQAPRCTFYARAAVPGGYTYERVEIRTPPMAPYRMAYPPLVGDDIRLPGRDGTYRVVDRSWMYASYGSRDWPYGDNQPKVGPLLDLIIERADGVFHDEVEPDEGEGEDDGDE